MYNLPLNKNLKYSDLAKFFGVTAQTIRNNREKYLEELQEYYDCSITSYIASDGTKRFKIIAKERILFHDYIKQTKYKREVTEKYLEEHIPDGEVLVMKEYANEVYCGVWVKDQNMKNIKFDQAYYICNSWKRKNFGSGRKGKWFVGEHGTSEKVWFKNYPEEHRKEPLTEEEQKQFGKLWAAFFTEKMTEELAFSLATELESEKEGDIPPEIINKEIIKMIKDIYNSKDALSVKRVAAKLFNCESVSLGTIIFRSAF